MLHILYILHILHISQSYARIKVDSYDSLSLEKTLTWHNVITLIELVFKKNQSNYCCIYS